MATCKANLTDNLIKTKASAEFTRFRDGRYPLILKMHASRTTGSWYLVDFKADKWHKFGTWPLFNCKKALALVPDLMVKLQLDKPVMVSQFDTVGQLLEWYLAREKANKTISEKRRINIASSVGKHLIPLVGECDLLTFNNALCESLLIWPLQNTYALSTVRQHFQLLKCALNQALKNKLIEFNPLADTSFKTFISAKIPPKKAKLTVKHERDLVLSLMTPTNAPKMLCWFMLLHATRIGETRQLRWDYIDTVNKRMTLPSEITKTKEHVIELSDHAFERLITWHKQQAKYSRSAYMFPAKTRGPINENEANKYVQQVSKGGYTAHDLRKFCRGRWLDLGVDSLIAELLLNHALNDLQAAYIQTTGAIKKREALTFWAAHLVEVLASAKTETATSHYDFNAPACVEQ